MLALTAVVVQHAQSHSPYHPAMRELLRGLGSEEEARRATAVRAAIDEWMTDAARHRDYVGIYMAIECGADPTTHGDLYSVLYYAVGGGSALVAAVLAAGVDPNSGAGSPLVSACYGMYPEIVALLLGAGADPNFRDLVGHSPLKVALRHRDQITRSALLAGNEVPCVETSRAVVVAALLAAGADARGFASVRVARKNGVPADIVRALVAAGAK